MKTYSYWLDTAPPFPDLARESLPPDVDVAIVGGGLTGVSAALHLARKGARVVLLEKDRIGGGASGRNGGFATTGLSADLLAVMRRSDIETVRRLYFAYDEAIDLIESLAVTEKIDCDFARTGNLKLAYKPAHYRSLQALHDVLAASFGRETVLVPPDRLRSEVATDRYHGGLLDIESAGLHVGKFIRGLAQAAIRSGAILCEDAALIRIEGGSAVRHELHTTRGSVRSSQVLVATNGYTDGALPWYRRRVVPVGSFIIVTEPLNEALARTLIPRRRMVQDTKNLLYYFRLTPDDRMLFGGRTQFALSGPKADARSVEILRKGMVELFPELRHARIDYAWGGQVALTMDRLPHAGERNGVYYSLGYNGHGVQMATLMGKVMASVMNGDVAANPWRGMPFQAIPLHFGPPWFLPLADAYYRIKDLVS